MREVRLCECAAAEVGGGVLPGALCLADVDGDGEDEVAVGSATGRLAVFKYASSADHDDRLVHLKSWQLGGGAIVAVAGGVLPADGGVGACGLVVIDVLGTVHVFEPVAGGGGSSGAVLRRCACRRLPANLQHAAVTPSSIVAASSDGLLLALEPVATSSGGNLGVHAPNSPTSADWGKAQDLHRGGDADGGRARGEGAQGQDADADAGGSWGTAKSLELESRGDKVEPPLANPGASAGELGDVKIRHSCRMDALVAGFRHGQLCRCEHIECTRD